MNKNNKLGLKIVRTSQGLEDVLVVNGEQEWTKNIWDVRENLKNIENIENLHSDTYVLILSCIDGGHLLTIVSLIAGRDTDNTSAWIYIPDNLIISGKELAEIIEITKNEILTVRMNDELLKEKFSKAYEISPAKYIYAKSQTGQYAYRYYSNDSYTLQELLDAIHQPYYQRYKSIFLINKSSQLSCSIGDDLSQEPLYTSILANTPEEVDGFVPYINGKVFDSPMYVSEGKVIEITWKKNGYLPIKTQTKANKGFTYTEPTADQYRRIIPYGAINVTDEWNQPIQEYELSINHIKVNPGGSVPVSEAALNNVRIDVHTDGYDTKVEEVDFTKNSCVVIRLTKSSLEYNFELPLKNVEDDRIKIGPIITHERLVKSPIKGYVPERGRFSRQGINRMKYNPYNKSFWIKSAIILLVTLICGMAVGAWCWDKIVVSEVNTLRTENSSLESDVERLKSEYNPQNTEDNNAETAGEIDEVIKYLDGTNVWNRNKMEDFSQIRGLWDALNTHDFDKILGLEDLLKESQRFQKLVQAVESNKNKTFTNDYNTKNDFDITIESVPGNKGYIKALNDAKDNPAGSSSQSEPAESKDNNSEQGNWL